MGTMLQSAISLAVQAHDGQEDPPGQPYILHPMRVMGALAAGDDDAHQHETLLCVAILHDVVERTGVTVGALRDAGMHPEVVEAVRLLTHDPGETYSKYVVRLSKNPMARAVKLADLNDNADLKRVTFRATKAKKDTRRVGRYAASYKFLTGQITRTEYQDIMKRLE